MDKNNCETKINRSTMTQIQPLVYVLFILILIGNYYIMRIKAIANELDYNAKTAKKDFEDILKVILYSTLFWYVSNGIFVNDKTIERLVSLVIFFVCLIAMSNTYGFIEKRSGLNASLTSPTSTKKLLIKVGLPILLIALGYLGLLIHYTLIRNYDDSKEGIVKLILIILMAISIFTSAYMLVKKHKDEIDDEKKVRLHLHHFSIFYILTLMAASVASISIYNTTNTITVIKMIGVGLSGLTFGAFFHGACYYSADNVILN